MNLMSGRITRQQVDQQDAVERSGWMVGDQDGSPAGGDVLSFARIGFVTDAQDVECCGCESVAGYF